MATDRIVVVAESVDGKALPVSLELLTKARSLAGTVEAVTWGDSDAVAAQLGAYGATKVYAVGDLGGGLPGAPVAAALAQLVAEGEAPDAILIPTTYDGRDIAGRLSVRLGRPVLTNVVGLARDDEGHLVSEHAIFGGAEILKARFTGAAPGHLRRPGQVLRARGERRRRRPRWWRWRFPTWLPPGPRPSPNATSRSAPAPSWTRPRSWCRAAGAWARRAATS